MSLSDEELEEIALELYGIAGEIRRINVAEGYETPRTLLVSALYDVVLRLKTSVKRIMPPQPIFTIIEGGRDD